MAGLLPLSSESTLESCSSTSSRPRRIPLPILPGKGRACASPQLLQTRRSSRASQCLYRLSFAATPQGALRKPGRPEVLAAVLVSDCLAAPCEILSAHPVVAEMTANFHFRLPDRAPRRLVRESIPAWNFRHVNQDRLDAETSSWPVIRGAICAYLRHNLSDYDERLRARAEHDPEFRDQLAAQVAAQARRKYPWLRDDPRPSPSRSEEGAKALPFDGLSRSLSDL